jgi:Tfp pilus assembly PilM family ATPase
MWQADERTDPTDITPDGAAIMLFSPLGRLKNMNILHTGYPVAVDFGVSALKLLQVTGGEGTGADQGLKLVCAAMVPTPDDIAGDHAKRVAFQAAELLKLSKSLDLKMKRAVCGIPAVQTFCKHMQFPKGDTTPTAALVKATVPTQVGCHPEALLYRHVEVATGGTNGKNEVICLAASRELVGKLMGALAAAKMEPVGIHPEFPALLRAFGQMNGDGEAEGATLYLDLGAGATKVIIAHGTSLVFAKTINVGGRHMDQILARRLKCTVGESRAKRLRAKSLTVSAGPGRPAALDPSGESRAGDSSMALLNAAMAKHVGAEGDAPAPGAAVAERAPQAAAEESVDLREQLETLTDEVSMCLRYHDALFPGKRVARAVLVGGEARHRGLCQAVARAVRVPAQVADPMARVARTGGEPCVGVELTGPQPGWTLALGLSVSPTDL